MRLEGDAFDLAFCRCSSRLAWRFITARGDPLAMLQPADDGAVGGDIDRDHFGRRGLRMA